ncbi:MAG: carboxypeptidase-like regulatory domain-containing protein [Thermoplasmata archaeon]
MAAPSMPSAVRTHRKASAALVLLLVLSTLLGTALTTSGSAHAAPWSGSEPTPTNLTVFLHNSSTALAITGGLFASTVLTTTSDTATPWSGAGHVDVGFHYLTVPFYLFPRLAGPLFLNGTPQANIFVNQTGSTTSGAWTLTLYAISPSGAATLLGTPGKATYSSGYNGNLGLPLRITYGSALDVTLAAGWSLAANFSQAQGATADSYGFRWGDVSGSYYAGDIDLVASTYLSIDPAFLVGPGGTTVSNLNTSLRNPVVSLRANVTDPFGNYDYANWSVGWSVANSTGAPEGNGSMGPIAPAVPLAGAGYNETFAAPFNYSTLADGEYTFCANASDNSYHNDILFTGNYYGRIARGCTSFTVGLGPNPLTLEVEDSEGHPLVGARASLSGISNITNALGVVGFRLVNGSYTGTLIWQSIPVSNFVVTVDGPSTDVIHAAVYYPTFAVEDQAGIPLSDAFVYLVHPNGTQYPLMVTNATGTLSLSQVPAGSWGVTVIWHDSIVYSPSDQPAIPVDANAVYPILTQVYYQGFRVLEPGGTPVPSASVVVRNSSSGVLISFGITNSTGLTTSRIPAGDFTVLVYWQETQVAAIGGLALPASSNPYVITASLFSVTITAVDSQGAPVSGALVAITGPGGPVTNLLTNNSGVAMTVLPAGTYTFATTWQQVTVNTTTVGISQSTRLTLDLAVYYLTVDSVDSGGASLAGVFLQVLSRPSEVVAASAASTSQPTVFRLPVGQYAVVGTYKATYDLTPIQQTVNASFVLASSSTVTLRFSHTHPAFESTNEFYVVLGYAILGGLLVVLLALSLRRHPKHPPAPTPAHGVPTAGGPVAAPPPPKGPPPEWSESGLQREGNG